MGRRVAPFPSMGASTAALLITLQLIGGTTIQYTRNLAMSITFSYNGDPEDAWNTVSCAVNGKCFSSLNYVNYEECRFQTDEAGPLQIIQFDTEPLHDKLSVGGIEYSGVEGPVGVTVSKGETIEWAADYTTTAAGFEICVGEPCLASSNPSDDGSDGNFYCINEGIIEGVVGQCWCTSCGTGYR
jgi:hypothetical protein